MAEFSPDFDLREKCGVFGAFGVEDVAVSAMKAMVALNHRGQEGAGLVTYDGTDFRFAGNGGLVREILTWDVLADLRGDRAVGQTRYGTSGSSEDPHIQPIHESLPDGRSIWFAENGNQVDVSPMTRFLDDLDIHYDTNNSDSELKSKILGHFVMQGLSLDKAVEEARPLFTGAYSSLAMDEGSLVAWREEHGVRPLVLGRKGAGWMVASETCAIEAAEGEVVREVRPGEMIIITKDGVESRQLAEPNPKPDMFEAVYFAREDSEIFGQSAFSVRMKMGERLALEHPVDADIVVPVPNSAIPAALGFSKASGIPYLPAILKSSYIHRTFIGATEEIREEDRDMKLSVIRSLVKGKRVVLVDDSIVRGGTQKKIIRKLLKAGAAEVHVRIHSAPVKYPDFYGINTPKQKELAYVKWGGVEGIRRQIKATTLGFLSIIGMVEATGEPIDRHCLSAFNGEYPLDIGDKAKDLIPV